VKQDSTTLAERTLEIGGGLSLILFPLTLIIAFGMHFERAADFFVFKLRYEPNSAADFMATLLDPASALRYSLAHGVGYFAIPLIIPVALYLAAVLFKQRPWAATIGAAMACFGAIFMGGVFATWLSFAAVSNVSPDGVEVATEVLGLLTEMQGALLLTTTLSAFSLLGLMVLAGGLLFTDLVPKWSPALMLAGYLLIIVFTDLDNWMMIGAFLTLLGGLPITLETLRIGRRRRLSSAPISA
jgi:hypothetical protein